MKPILILIFSIILILHIVRLQVLQWLSIYGFPLDALYKEIEKVRVENFVLEEALIEKTSYRVLREKAEKAGFVQATYYFIPNTR